ncbi:hypothetical protein ABGB12_24410 [Actinocorallia sp. B10E7]|uniref:hypothetical protein n=1 Tax=Actinocorallia sp. B10E7 TaxID=3153558 RepID=UPI00325C520C
MRRTAVVTMTAVVLGAGVGLTAVPANAAPTQKRVTKKWSTFDGKKGSIWRTIKGDGTYTRNGDKITISGWIRDTKKNGWSPTIQFRVWRGGKWHHSVHRGVEYVSTKLPADQKFNYKVNRFWSTTGTHLQVREGASKSTSSKVVRVGPWKKLF